MFQATLIFLLLFPLLVIQSEPLKVSLQAKSAILINAETGAILYEKEAHTLRYPASTTKIATALYALEKKLSELDRLVTVSKEALKMKKKDTDYELYPSHFLEFDGTSMQLKLGEILTLESLLYGMMLISGNDAANAVAEFCSGSIEKFMKELNGFLRKKGFKNTFFNNPHGLHHTQHMTTAFDMAFIAMLALKKPKFREIVKTVDFKKPATNLQPEGIINQRNRLIKKGKFFYPKALGIKTGFHSISGCNLVAAAEQQGRTLIAVLFGYERADPMFTDAISLFETAFKEKKIARTLFIKDEDQFFCKVAGATKKLHGFLKEDVTVEYYPTEEPKLSATLKWHHLKPPIKKDTLVGELKIMQNERVCSISYPIYAVNDLEKSWFGICLEVLSNIIGFFARGSRAFPLVVSLTLFGFVVYFFYWRKSILEK